MDSGAVAVLERTRDIVIVGTHEEAKGWLARQGQPIDRVIVVDRPRRLIARSGEHTHLVVMPSYWNIPDHFLYRVEIAFLQERGATLEWG